MKRVPWWVWVSLAPLGLGAWTPLVPGIALRRRLWIALGVVLSLVTIAGWTIAVNSEENEGDLGGIFIILGWVGALVGTLLIRRPYLREVSSTFSRDREAAEARLKERRDALELAENDPALALALRIVAVREEVSGFSSVSDFGAVLDLDGNAVERLRGRTVFLPR